MKDGQGWGQTAGEVECPPLPPRWWGGIGKIRGEDLLVRWVAFITAGVKCFWVILTSWLGAVTPIIYFNALNIIINKIFKSFRHAP